MDHTQHTGHTPMMQQYWGFRQQIPKDTLLFFRLGDFFELFLEDAQLGAAVLGLTLTHRSEIPMAGIPAHTIDNYLQKLLQAGYKIAICDQIEPPQPGKLVRRAITRILTPGTACEVANLEQPYNQYLLALDYMPPTAKHPEGCLAVAWADVACADVTVAFTQQPLVLIPTLLCLPFCEILIKEGAREQFKLSPSVEAAIQPLLTGRSIAALAKSRFDVLDGEQKWQEALGTLSLKGFGVQKQHPGLGPAGALLFYIRETLCPNNLQFHKLHVHEIQDTVLMDPHTLLGLEIFKTATGEQTDTLFHTLNQCRTAAGSRLLERWLHSPLRDINEIRQRQQLISLFVHHRKERTHLSTVLKDIRDLARIVTRIQSHRRVPREMGALSHSLKAFPHIISILDSLSPSHVELDSLLKPILGFEPLNERLSQALEDQLPQKLGDAPTIRSSYDDELSQLRALTHESEHWIQAFEQSEQLATGIKTLKVKYHGSLGYCIEVTKANAPLVPAHYIRRQSTTNHERFTTPALSQRQAAVLSAKDQTLLREHVLFEALIQNVLTHSQALYHAAQALAQLDVYLTLAEHADKYHYTCPIVDESRNLVILEGRHAVVEAKLEQLRYGLAGSTSFTPNDLAFNDEVFTFALITGPNMAGKSTFIRQVALIVLLAQIGSWVPARQAHIGVVDALFARIGSADELSKGHSTFMVEMTQTAQLIHKSTANSLILLDEVGRGTSTYDGLSLAWAIVEHLHAIGTRTLFATHYHELTQLEGLLPRVKNFSMLVEEQGEHIHFLHRVVTGPASRSYGIHVAKLAGLPQSIIERAQTVLTELEHEGKILIELLETNPHHLKHKTRLLPLPSSQLDLF